MDVKPYLIEQDHGTIEGTGVISDEGRRRSPEIEGHTP